MAPYIALIVLTVIVRIALSANGETLAAKRSHEKTTISFFFLGYLTLLCLRADTVGCDLATYIPKWFYAFQEIDWVTLFEMYEEEWLFVGLTKLIGEFTSSKQIYLTVVATITVLPIMYLYREEAEDALLCCSAFLITLLFEMFFSGLRQGVAIAMGAPAYLYAKKKKIIPFLMMVLIAYGFHMTGLFIALIYPVYHLRITRKELVFVVPLIIVVYLFNDVILTKLFGIFGEHYIDKGYSVSTGTTGQTGLMMLYLIYFVYCFVVPDEGTLDKEFIGLRNLLILATIVQLFAPIHRVPSRINYYYNLFVPITLTKVPKYSLINKRISQLATLVMIAVFIMRFIQKDDPLQVFDYKLFFE